VGAPLHRTLEEIAAAASPLGGSRTDERWRRQLHTWEVVAARFDLDINRYDDFSYLCFLNIEDAYVQNYVQFHKDDSPR